MSTRTKAQKERLIDLATWAAGEDARRRLGLPSEWYQGFWLTRDPAGCGTACCIAGRVALQDGGIPVVNDDNYDALDRETSKREWESSDSIDATRVWLPKRHEPVDVEEYARKALGLSQEEADDLFNGTNDLDAMLREIARLIEATLVD